MPVGERYSVECEHIDAEMLIVEGFAGYGTELPVHAEIVRVIDSHDQETIWERQVADRHLRPILFFLRRGNFAERLGRTVMEAHKLADRLNGHY